jgi:uncharacterized membrane protein
MAATEPEVAKLQQPVPLFFLSRHYKEYKKSTVPKKSFYHRKFKSMPAITMTQPATAISRTVKAKAKRIESIDLLRGIVMIIMALDHVRDYFHNSAFIYDPTDLAQTNVILFFTRWITHFCAPVFVFLAGISAYLYGTKKSRKELSLFLLKRGVWLVFAELFILSLFRTFNPAYPYFNLQVIWAIGICMITLSALVYMSRRLILLTGILLIAAHNLLDNVHIPGDGILSFIWALLHEPRLFNLGAFSVNVQYPLLPWIGIMAVGYCFGSFFNRGYDPEKRRKIFLYIGIGAIALFIILRLGNFYGDPIEWSVQKNTVFSFLSFLNVTKYPPSLLYILVTLGPALIFLALMEKPLNTWMEKITILGRVPMFYYLAHILIHIFAVVAALISGYKLSDMILSTRGSGRTAVKGLWFRFANYIWGVDNTHPGFISNM